MNRLLKASVPLVLAAMTLIVSGVSQPALAGGPTSADRGSISGTVTELATGLPLDRICVSAEDLENLSGGFTLTDALGQYEVANLPEGAYEVAFQDCPVTFDSYFISYYDGQPDRDSADPVMVIAGRKTSGVDAQMSVGGVISGTVTDEETGEPLQRECVVFNNLSLNFITFVYSDESGDYSERLRNGDYKIRFSACGLGGPRIDEWYDDTADFDSAEVITVFEGSFVSEIDAQIARGTFGDVDCNRTVDALDAVLLLRFDARQLVDPSQGTTLKCVSLADVNADGVKNAIDASLILQFAAGLLDELRAS